MWSDGLLASSPPNTSSTGDHASVDAVSAQYEDQIKQQQQLIASLKTQLQEQQAQCTLQCEQQTAERLKPLEAQLQAARTANRTLEEKAAEQAAIYGAVAEQQDEVSMQLADSLHDIAITREAEGVAAANAAASRQVDLKRSLRYEEQVTEQQQLIVSLKTQLQQHASRAASSASAADESHRQQMKQVEASAQQAEAQKCEAVLKLEAELAATIAVSLQRQQTLNSKVTQLEAELKAVELQEEQHRDATVQQQASATLAASADAARSEAEAAHAVDVSELEGKLANASAQLKSLQQSSSGDAGELAEAMGKVEALERQLAGSDTRLVASDAAVVRLKGELAELEGKFAALKEIAEEDTRVLGAAQVRVSVLEKSVESMEARQLEAMIAVQSQLGNARTELQTLRQTSDADNAELASVKAKAADLEESLQQSRAELSAVDLSARGEDQVSEQQLVAGLRSQCTLHEQQRAQRTQQHEQQVSGCKR